MKQYFYYLLPLCFALSCGKIDIPESDGTFVVMEQLKDNIDLRRALVNRLYTQWINNLFNANNVSQNFGLTLGLYADEFELMVPVTVQAAFENRFLPNAEGLYGAPNDYFSQFFQISNAAGQLLYIYRDMEHLGEQDQQLMGEAQLFIAMSYQKAKLLYGELPVFTDSKDFNGNFRRARESIERVNEHIANQAHLALTNLSERKYDFGMGITNGPAFRLNKDVARQFLSDFYLECGKLDSAIYFADLLIDKYPLEANLSNTFILSSSERIWSMQPLNPNYSVSNANLYNLTSQPSLIASRPVIYSNAFLSQISIDDKRWAWIGTSIIGGRDVYFATKYSTLAGPPNNIDPPIMFRVSKAHFNKVEALWQMEQQQNAYDAFLPLWNKNHSESLEIADFDFDLIIKERWIEFATEHGDRWFTLRRYPQKLEVVMNIATTEKSQGTSQWEDYKKYFPIHSNVISRSPFIQQNPGYSGY